MRDIQDLVCYTDVFSVVTQCSFLPGEERCVTTSKMAVKQSMQDPNTLTIQVPKVINTNFLKTISLHNQENRLGELMKKLPKRKCFDLLSNSLNLFFMEMYRNKFGEFVCGYWGLKG